jgi:hypothetical protein
VSPTFNPTARPTEEPTTLVIKNCDYAMLDGFGPREDAVYELIQEGLQSENATTPSHCKSSCDSTTRCIAFSWFNDTDECTFYDIVGPVELKFGTDVELYIKSRACLKPQASDPTKTCRYSERNEYAVADGWYLHTMENVTEVNACRYYCDTTSGCQTFQFTPSEGKCKFYRAVTTWSIDVATFSYIKDDRYCLMATTPQPTVQPTDTGSPTGSPTTGPTAGAGNSTNRTIIIIEEEFGATYIFTSMVFVIILVYLTVFCLAFARYRREFHMHIRVVTI